MFIPPPIAFQKQPSVWVSSRSTNQWCMESTGPKMVPWPPVPFTTTVCTCGMLGFSVALMSVNAMQLNRKICLALVTNKDIFIAPFMHFRLLESLSMPRLPVNLFVDSTWEVLLLCCSLRISGNLWNKNSSNCVFCWLLTMVTGSPIELWPKYEIAFRGGYLEMDKIVYTTFQYLQVLNPARAYSSLRKARKSCNTHEY